MPDNRIDLGVYFLIILYPVAALFIIEIICRTAKIPSWIKLVAQGIMCVGFGIAYVTVIVAHWLTSLVLWALAFVLFYQAKIAKINPEKSLY